MRRAHRPPPSPASPAVLHDALSRAERRAGRRWPRGHWLGPSPGVSRPGRDRAVRWCRMFTGQRIRVAVRETVGAELCRHGYIEAPVTRVLLDHLKPGMSFVDAGAQYGYHALVASLLVGGAGSVVAFEPARDTLGHLRATTGGHDNIRVEPVALGAEAGRAVLTDFGVGFSSLNTLLGTARVPETDRPPVDPLRYEVPATTLDAYVEGTGIVPDAVKLDVEGAELAILQGMEAVLERHAPLLIVETGDYAGTGAPATAASIDLLERHGYRAFEYHAGLRPHERRPSYGYDNLFFRKAGRAAP